MEYDNWNYPHFLKCMSDFTKPEHMNKAVFEKLIQCSTSDDLKLEVLEICALEKDETAVKNTFNTFSRKHQLEGKTVKLNDNETLGHIKEIDSLLIALAGRINFKRNRLKKIFTALSFENPGQMKGDIDSFFEALENKSINISGGNPWLFRTTMLGFSPFKTKNPECLPARLALPRFNKGDEDYIGFIVDKIHLANVKEPTISDAEYEFSENLWSPGGKTKPLPHCSICEKQSGLDEVVTSPVLLKLIKRKTIRIRV